MSQYSIEEWKDAFVTAFRDEAMADGYGGAVNADLACSRWPVACPWDRPWDQDQLHRIIIDLGVDPVEAGASYWYSVKAEFLGEED